VTADYVRGMQGQGFHPAINEIIAMKVQGVPQSTFATCAQPA